MQQTPNVNDSMWPPVSHETLPWTRDYESYPTVSRRQARAHSGPYAAAITPDIASVSLRLNDSTLSEAEDASLALAKFDADVGHIAAPFGSILLRTESASSSEIENLTSGARQIGLAEIGESDSPNARLIVSNVRAMESALALADNIDANAIIAMQSQLLSATNPEITGQWRQEQVWIGGGSVGPHQATFVPPQHSRVPAAIDDLIEFIRRDDLPLLPQIAIAHAQFETIHPFPDGNGRTGRALVQSMLRAKGITEQVTVPVSAGLLMDTAAYFRSLTDYREGNPDEIVSTFARAAYGAIANGRQLVDDLSQVREQWTTEMVGLRSHAGARRVAEMAFEHPVLDARVVIGRLEVSGPTAYAAIESLVDRGILVPKNQSKRNRIWFAPAVLDALDAFASRAKRDRP